MSHTYTKQYYEENHKDQKEIIIPDTINGEKVKYIEEKCFEHNWILEKITFPNSLKIIKELAFNNCQNLKEVIIDKQESELLIISKEAFLNCKALTNFTFNDRLHSIKDSAFYACNLKKVILGDNVSRIEKEAFGSNENLIKVILSDRVRTIETDCFSDCENLTYINLDKVEHIGTTAFCRTNLKNLILKAKSVNQEAFFGNKNIEWVYIDDKCEFSYFNGKPDAFYQCNIKKVYTNYSQTNRTSNANYIRTLAKDIEFDVEL